MLGLLPQVTSPALLITGGLDPLTSPAQRAAFLKAAPRHEELEFPRAGHFVHADDPVPYAKSVMNYVRVSTEGLAGPAPGPATGWP
jgi:pimeloyl-ACP methyl ester carboxylesterase